MDDAVLWCKVKEAADLMAGLRACLTKQIAALSWRDDLSHSDNRSCDTSQHRQRQKHENNEKKKERNKKAFKIHGRQVFGTAFSSAADHNPAS